MEDPNDKKDIKKSTRAPASNPGSQESELDESDDCETTVLGQGGSAFEREEIEDLETDEEGGDFDEEPSTDDESESQVSGGFRVRGRSAPRKIQAASDIFPDLVLGRARANASKIRTHLTGTIQVSLSDKMGYLFSWNSSEPEVHEKVTKDADCTIQIKESDLVRIALGSLNPQIAMLSDKVHVIGQTQLALYFFNLIAPRS